MHENLLKHLSVCKPTPRAVILEKALVFDRIP